MSSWSSKIGGMIYCAPVGTALPTDVESTIDAAFTRIAYITSDGLQNTQDRNVSRFRRWTGAMANTTSSHAEDTWKFNAIEVEDPAINRAMYGRNNVEESQYAFQVSISEGDSEMLSWIFDIELWHGLRKRVVMPKAKIIAREDVVHNGESLISLGVTLLALADENKKYHYEYYTSSATTPGEQPTPQKSWGERIEDLESSLSTVQNRLYDFPDDLDVDDEGYAYFVNSGNRINGPYGPFSDPDVKIRIGDFIDNLEVDEDGNLWGLNNGQRIVGPIAGISGGGGGGGGGNNAVLTVINASGFIAKTISAGLSCPVTITWSSLENQVPTGDGVARITVNNVTKAVLGVSQGTITIDLKDYLTPGTNAVKVRISDIYDNHKDLAFTIIAVELTISSSFDYSIPFTGAIVFPYTPTGNVSKTVHFIVDGTALQEVVTTASNRQLTYTIPAQAHGAHTLEVYFTAEVSSETVESNHLWYQFASVTAGNNTPVITSQFHQTSTEQYMALNIPFQVYTPNAATSPVVISVGGDQVASLTVDRTEQIYTVRANDVGNMTISFASGTALLQIVVNVTESTVDVEAETDQLALYLTSEGRSNQEEHPEAWSYNTIEATLSDFNWVSDGWQRDDDGNTVLRVSGAARVTIPYQIFASDFRGTGKTIEIEFATRNVLDVDAQIVSCYSGDRGLRMTTQFAELRSEQSQITMQYKEEEHIRLSFVCEKRTENRLLMIYVNGIPSGVVQYPVNDDFSQVSPVNISIGSSMATTDIYCIRVYDNNLNRTQILNNWIADTPDGGLMVDRYVHNNVYDEYGNIVIAQLPNDLPYMVLSAPQLPQYKGDKKTITGYYVDPVNSGKSFEFSGCQINVQGTSSAPYARKNYDLQFKNGFEMRNGQHAANYALADDIVPFNRFVIKADVASSEGANNVELVKLFVEVDPFQPREKDENPKVRQGIYGFPIVVFWNDTANNTVSFLGKYNFNLPKRAPGPYGYSGNDESWEFQNNTSDLMLFKTDYFDQTMVTDPDTGDTKEKWRYDYEARFPEDTWTNYAKLQELQSFVVSCDRSKATGATISAKTYEGTTYTKDTAAYRLAKFRAEFSKYAEVNSFLFYYLFTELFLMVDSRAKNLFIGFHGSDATGTTAIDRKAVAEPYDMDTAMGTNNEGSLVFGFSLEDTDHLTGGANVFNGQESVLWNNVRDAFPTEIRQMYQTLRSAGTLSFATLEQRYEDHQSKWPEAVWIEDAWFKYIDPLIAPDPGKEATAVYLPMMQGSKESQRRWWLSNRFRYMDSKWNAGDALSQVIQLRGYAKADITLVPYTDLYPTVKFGSYLVQTRGVHGQSYVMECPLDEVNDTEIYIYSAPQIASVGDLSGLKVGFADFSQATRLQIIKVGDSSASYTNANLNNLQLGTNRLLTTLDARNCTALGTGDQKVIDLTGCTSIQNVYFSGTKILGVDLPNGGVLDKLYLPGTITSLILRNQPNITDFQCPDFSNLTTLWLENSMPQADVVEILDDMPANARVRLVGVNWTFSTASAVDAVLDNLDTMRGLDEYGNNVDTAQIIGRIHIAATVTGAQMATIVGRYPYLTITADHVTATLRYYTWDGGTLLETQTINDGGNGSYTGTPTRASDARATYTFAGWSTQMDSLAADPDATKAVWADRDVYAAYTAAIRTYTVYFYNGSTLLQTVQNVPYGGTATYTGSTPTYTGSNPEDWEFTGWSPSPVNITGQTSCYAQYKYIALEETITDSWEQIIAAVNNGTYATRYSVGDTKILDLGSEGNICMQIAAFDADDKADGSGKAAISWISEQVLTTQRLFNPGLETVYNYEQGPSFVRETTNPNGYYNSWNAKNAGVANNTAKISITVTALVDGILKLYYTTGNATNARASIKINGTEIVQTLNWNQQQYSLSMTAGTTYVIVFEHTVLLDTNTTNPYFRLADSNGYASKAKIDAIVTMDSIVIDNCTVRIPDHYTEGTGAIGGWEKSELRTWLRETVAPQLPAAVSAAIVPVTKTQPAMNTAGTIFTQSTTDTVWIPSYAEVYGNASLYYPLFQNTNANRIKKRVAYTSASAWWTRTARDDTPPNQVAYVGPTGSYSNYAAQSTSGYSTICFCM